MISHPRRSPASAAVLVLASLLAAPAPAQPDPLRGPDVNQRESKTLVHRGMTREFTPVEGRPEAAALELLDLDADTAARARAVVDARATDIAMLLVDEIDSVREITDQMTAGDTGAARQTLLKLWERYEPGRPRSPLLVELGEILSPEQMVETRRLLDEYWDAWIESEGAAGGTRREVERRLAFALFQQEVREAYDISLRRYKQALDAIYDATDPTPEQREAIRNLVIQHIKDTRLQADPEQRRAAMRRIYDLLDQQRRAKLFDYMLRVALPG